MQSLKLTAVGDGTVGKTCLLTTYAQNRFPAEYVATVFDNYAVNTIIDGQRISLSLWDTAGQDDYMRMRSVGYPDTDIFLVCYSVADRVSYDNIVQKWIPEVKHYCPYVPICLVATKSDLRDNRDSSTEADLISTREGHDLRREIKAQAFYEVSALAGHNVVPLFDAAARLCIEPKTPRKKKPKPCFII